MTLFLINFCFCWVLRDRKEVYLGDDNSLTLTFNARNEGEGGAYEAELYVVLPPEADYSGIARNNEVNRCTKHATQYSPEPLSTEEVLSNISCMSRLSSQNSSSEKSYVELVLRGIK